MTQKSHGFTIIELLLAMTFVSMLLLAIAMTIVQIANTYNKGMILKEVNQVSRSLGEELARAMRSSSTFSNDPAARRYVNNAWGGRLCMGQYSYIWNYGTALSEVNTNRNQYSSPNMDGNKVTDGSGTRYEITFVKAPDTGGTYCIADASSGKYPNINPVGAVELMKSGDHTLAIHAFGLDSAATAKDTLSSQQIYKVSYTIGTDKVNAITSNPGICNVPGGSGPTAVYCCKPPGQPGSDLNYCEVQKFTVVLRVVSGVN